ncbi:xyloglucan endotransglucosylase/hydrolase protein 3-like [Andrographis paniculata]|uniref:xyloglucan endotransglucosylase/hydrolase protein 3-like n=1 Tax=Andrographis paniculata TaxID=175694 RepID=UPI0021E931AB|nr:xyloglucan endotransglucosylase/hydrolase protein 3-like [Andrographis paniculata]
MAAHFVTISFIAICSFVILVQSANDNRFQTYYTPLWGFDHLTVNPQGTEVELKFDQSSGCGFRSKLDYSSGKFHIQMKVPEKKSGGIVPNFYLYSVPGYGQNPGSHFEIDFEFLGSNGTLQTNVYNDDMGHREQRFRLWFDPSQDFHSYDFLWNSHQIVFYVDNIPIRVFKNMMDKGIPYPDKPLHVEATIWNANWAGEVDWGKAPYVTRYRDFGFDACPVTGDCGSKEYFWNQEKYWDLSPAEKRLMKEYRSKYMVYDYCTKTQGNKECSL